MKPIVVGRYYVDNYLVLFITKTLVNVTSIDCSEISIYRQCSFYLFIVYDIHLKDDHKHKRNQTKENAFYDFNFYFESYHTRSFASVNDLTYLLSNINSL